MLGYVHRKSVWRRLYKKWTIQSEIVIGQKRTRREPLKSALYLHLKKRRIFKTVKGGPFGLVENPVCCKISKKNERDPLETKKLFEKRKMRILKQSHSAKILKRGDPLGFLAL